MKNFYKNSIILSWETEEFLKRPKSMAWHIGYFIVFFLLIAYAAFYGSIITVITFVLLGIIGYTFANKKPEKITYSIERTGIGLGKSFYPYKTIKHFWIVYRPPDTKTLNFETTAYLNRFLSMQLGDEDPVKIRNILKEYLPEDLDKEESISDKITRTLKF